MSPLQIIRPATDEEKSTEFPQRHRGPRDEVETPDENLDELKKLIDADGFAVMVHDGDWAHRDANGDLIRYRRKLRDKGIEIETTGKWKGDIFETVIHRKEG